MKHLLLFSFIMPCLVNAQAPCIANSYSGQFSGSGSYVQLAASSLLDITDSITVEAWINPASFAAQSAQNTIVCKHGWSQGESGYVLRCGGSGILSWNIGGTDINGVNQSWQPLLSATNAIPLSTWTHVAGTYDGDSLRMYINGIQVNSLAFNGSITPSSAYPMRIGRLADPAQSETRYFNGKLDEIRIWNRALSGSEILSNYNHHIIAANVTGLVAYWRFNDGSGSVLSDSSTNALNGQLISTTFSTDVPFNEIPPQPSINYSGGIFTSSAPANNQWYFMGNPIPCATAQSYQPLQPGTYNVVVTAPGGCTASSNPVNVTNSGITETKDNNWFEFNSISQNSYSVNFLTKSKNSLAALYDENGRSLIIYKELVEPVIFDLNRYAHGIYFLHLVSDNNRSVIKLARQ